MKTLVYIIAAAAGLVSLLTSCDKDYRYSNNSSDQASSADVLRNSTWRAEKQTDRSFMNGIQLSENSVNYDSTGSDNLEAFDLVFSNGVVYKVMRNSNDTVETSRYTYNGVTLLLFNYDSGNNDVEGQESSYRTVKINGTVMTSIDLGMNRSGEDVDADTNQNNNANDGILKRLERITMLRRVR